MRIPVSVAMALVYLAISASWIGIGLASSPEDLPPGSICGIVSDYEGNPIPGAAVIFSEENAPYHTGVDGRFCAADLQPGNYSVRIEAAGLRPERQDGIELTSAGLVELEILLQLARLENNVTVTATRTRHRLDEVPVRTEVISAQSIEQRGAVTLAEVLEVSTGLKVESGCSNCNFTSLRINGLEGGYSQVLVDGMAAFSSLDTVYGLEQLPTVLVDQIEIIKGGGSALYGGGAVGGVVNVITKQPRETSGSIEAYFNSTGGEPGGTTKGYGSFTGNDGRTSLFAFGSFSAFEAYDRDQDGETETARRNLRIGGLRFFQRALGESAELQLGLDVTRESRRGGSDLDKPPHESLVAEEIFSRRAALTAQWNHFLGTSTFYKIQFSHSESAHDSYYGVNFDPNAYGVTDNPLTGLAATVNHSLSSHNLLVGTQLEHETVRDFRPGYDREIQETYHNLGLFFQDDWKLSNQTSLLAGVRVDKHNQIERSIVSPRVSFLYSPRSALQFRATAATGFRPPKVYDEDLHAEVAGGVPGFVVNAPGLVEERASTLSLSTNYIISQGSWGGIRIEGNGFYTRLRDTFLLTEVSDVLPDEEALVFLRTNGPGSRVYGLELNTDFQLTPFLDVEAGWTFQRSRLDKPEPEFGLQEFYRFPGSYGYVTGRYTNRRFRLGATFSHSGSMWLKHYAGYIPEDRVERTPSYRAIDLNLEVPIPQTDSRIKLVANVFNLLDTFQEDLDRGPYKHSGYVYGPRRPRSLAIGLKYSF